MKINKKINKLKKYVVSKRGDYDDIKKLDWNENAVEIEKKLKNKYLEATQEIVFSEYPKIKNEKLLFLLSEYCKIEKQNIDIFNGSDSALKYIFETFVDEDTGVLVFSPHYSQIDTFIKMQTSKIKYCNLMNIFDNIEYNFSCVEDYDVIYLSNPNNPTGYMLRTEQIEDLLQKNEHKLFIVDEAYCEFSKSSCVKLVKRYKNLIVTRTFSKAFGLASIRLGYICTDANNINLINKIKNQKEVNSFAQALGIVALQNIKLINMSIDKINKNRQLFCKQLRTKKIQFIESEANFVLVKTKNHRKVLDELLNNKILVRDRSQIKNLENCIRITIGEEKDMLKILKILEENNE